MKFILASCLCIFCMLTITEYAAITKNDVEWSWTSVKNNWNGEAKSMFKEACKNNVGIQEYVNRCRGVTLDSLASKYADEALAMLESKVTTAIDGREILTLDSLVGLFGSDVNTKVDISAMLLAEVIADNNNYRRIFNTGKSNSSSLLTKKNFESYLINNSTMSEDEKNSYRKSFAQIYYVQHEILNDSNKELTEGWMTAFNDAQNDENGTKVLKTSYVYNLLYEKDISMVNAPSYDNMDESLGVNTDDNYIDSYTLFFALTNLNDNQRESCLGSYIKIMNLQEEAKQYNGQETVWMGNVSTDVKEKTVISKSYMPLSNNLDSIQSLMSATYDLSVVDWVKYSDNDIMEDIIYGKFNLASMLYKLNETNAEYTLTSDGKIEEVSRTIKGVVNEVKDKTDLALYGFYGNSENTEQDYNYFCETDVEKEYLFNLPKVGDNVSPLSWFKFFLDGRYTLKIGNNDFGVIALPGEVQGTTFIFDPESSTYYYLYVSSDGKRADLYKDWKEETPIDDNTNNENWIEGIDTVKIRQRTNKTYVTFDVWSDLEDKVNTLKNSGKLGDLYEELTKIPEVQNKVSDIFDTSLTVSDITNEYESFTIAEMGNVKASIAYRVDLTPLNYCPDELNTSPICSDGWWSCAWQFLNKGASTDGNKLDTGEVDKTITSIKKMIFDVGNVIFILVTAFLGVKYIWGGVDSKFSVKNSLMTLVVAAIVFYGWDAVTNILDVKGLFTGNDASGGHMSMVTVIYNTIMYIINIAAVGGIIYIGIKYMMAGADGKSELKLKAIPVIMGIIMVYGTVNLISFILKIIEGIDTSI